MTKPKGERLQLGTEKFALLVTLTQRDNLALAAAEKLVEEIADQYLFRSDRLPNSVMNCSAIDMRASAGKPLSQCQTKRIRLILLTKKTWRSSSNRGSVTFGT